MTKYWAVPTSFDSSPFAMLDDRNYSNKYFLFDTKADAQADALTRFPGASVTIWAVSFAVAA